MNSSHSLKRSLTLPLVTFFGLGNILGAGIYVLVGKVAAQAGFYAPLAFLVAALIAGVSAFTYAELSARYPHSAGEAVYLEQGLNMQWLTISAGLIITLSGMVSSSVLAHGFAGYFSVFFDWPKAVLVTALIVMLGGLAIWGVNQSVFVAAVFTLIEVLGLVYISWVGVDYIFSAQVSVLDSISAAGVIPWIGVFSGAFLAFYAYLGFEDMVNLAEEVKQPQRNMPLAIMIAMIISTILYALVASVSVLVIEPISLSQSEAPLADVYQVSTGKAPVMISLIGIFAVINGALIQIIMASRLLYGMANNKWLPAPLAVVNPVTRTPIRTTLLVLLVIMILSLAFELVQLAKLTSYLVLTVFTLVNLALVRIKLKGIQAHESVRVYPLWVPVLGFILTASLLAFQTWLILSST